MAVTAYDVQRLPLDQKRDLLQKAKKLAFNWWVDQLDCRVSMARQKIDMRFEQALAMLDDDCFFNVYHRQGMGSEPPHVEFGFRKMGRDTDLFLWIQLTPEAAQPLTEGLTAR